LIDGSIDRQFLAHPAVSDAFYFALLVSTRKEQVQKTEDLLFSLSLKACSQRLRTSLKAYLEEDTKSLLLGERSELLYESKKIPFLDRNLHSQCLAYKQRTCFLYLNGALTTSLYTLLAPHSNLTVILDNFTLYQNIAVHDNRGKTFRPRLLILNPVEVKRIFVKQETSRYALSVPENISVYNLFREDFHEVRI
jgi:hypothetical protein